MRRCFVFVCVTLWPVFSYAELASAKYVGEAVADHATNTDNPHNVTVAQLGLENVQNVDSTDASTITKGTLDTARLNIGAGEGTVAAGNDVRFNTIPTVQPTGTPPEGQVFVWFE